MGQHRTKKDKINAALIREKQSFVYSLSENQDPLQSKKVQKLSQPNNLKKEILDVNAVKKDLLRTSLSLTVILILLGCGFFFLR